MVGRGAVNQKGPEASFLAALHAIRGAGRKLPVNLVLVAEGEEEIGSPHFPQIVRRPEVLAALRKCTRSFHALGRAGSRRQRHHDARRQGRGRARAGLERREVGTRPAKDVHSSLKAMSTARRGTWCRRSRRWFRADGNTPAIDGFADKARPLSAAEKKMIAEAARRLDEKVAKKQFGVEHWIHDVSYQEALELLQSRPTVNIEGLVGGYTGPGGKTILPHRAVAKLDLRLVPDMKADEALAALKAHLAKHGFGDIEVNMTGGYDPDQHLRRRSADPRPGGGLSQQGDRSDHFAAQRGLVAGIRLHRRSAAPARRPLRPGPRQRRARARRVLRDRIDESESAGNRRRGASRTWNICTRLASI